MSQNTQDFNTVELPVEVFEQEEEGGGQRMNNEVATNRIATLVRTTVGADSRYQCEDWPVLETTLSRDTPLMRNAAAPDIPSIKVLAHDLCLEKARKRGSKEHLRRSSGFFLSHLTDQDYTDYMSTAEHFLVLHLNGTLVGFILAYSSELIDPKDPHQEVDVYIRDRVATEKPFVLVKQLVVDPAYKHLGYAELLYMEVYARVVHWHGDDASPRSVYTEIPASHMGLQEFHTRVGYNLSSNKSSSNFFTPAQNSPRAVRSERRWILANHDVMDSLNMLAARLAGSSTLDTRPVYDASSMLDPHCVGVGISLYWIEPPDPSGTFYADVRVQLKWRHSGIEKLYKHPRLRGQRVARTDIDLKEHGKQLRLPRYALNEFNTNTTQKYAYIDKNDPHDVITLQHVMRGKFIGKELDLRDFPADTQMLEFKFRMWDNDPDDRCRYFRQLYFVDNTPWQLGVKRQISVPTCSFFATQVQVGQDDVAGTSFLTVRVPCVRNTGYYLRTVAIPLFFIASLTLTSIGLRGLAPRIELNTVLLLTNVAYLFVTKDETPKTAHVTRLDLVTYTCFLAPWFLIVLNYISFRLDMSLVLTDNISYIVCGGVLGVLGCMIFAMRFLFVMKIARNPALGKFDTED